MPSSDIATANEPPSKPQYDAIGATYNFMRENPTERIESSNLLAAITPNVVGARVLDLACGTGHFTRKLVDEWGAASAVGVDISPIMVDAAKKLTGDGYGDRVQFIAGDGQSLGRIDDEGFDLVTAAWLLPYAGTEDELVDMFSTISANLKSENGIFAGITRPSASLADLDALAARENEGDRRRAPPMRLTYQYYARNERMGERLDAGWRVLITSWDEKGEEEVVKFTNFHLPNEVIERAAKRGGMRGKFEWKPVRMMEEIRERAVSEYGEEFWVQYFGSPGPHFGLFVVKKGDEE